MKIIEVINLTKKYKNPVLENINYDFYEGKTYLIVGANGSGKSTFIKLIMELIYPSLGYLKREVKNISYVPDNLAFPEFLTIKKFLFNLGLLYQIEKESLNDIIEKLLSSWNLSGEYKLNELSKGMKQKVLIVQSFMKDAPIFIFDEPLNGLDKEMQEHFFYEVLNLKKRNKTIIIVSHQVEEFRELYDHKLEISEGKINEVFS